MKTKFSHIFIAVLAAAFAFSSCGKDDDGGDSQYTVAVSVEGSGVAGADKLKANQGEMITLTAIPADKYEFVKWTVVGGGVTLFPALTSNPASFTMPAGNVSVKAEFAYSGVTINGVTWSEFNVNTPGTFTAKAEDYGMFYQWGIKVGWSSADPLTPSLAGASWTYPISGAEGDVWTSANDPCPTGWSVPTKGDYEKLLETAKVDKVWTSTGVKGYKFTDKTTPSASIFLPAAGCRSLDDGALDHQGSLGFYWSATSFSTDTAWSLTFYDGYAAQNDNYRSYGFTVRCVLQ